MSVLSNQWQFYPINVSFIQWRPMSLPLQLLLARRELRTLHPSLQGEGRREAPGGDVMGVRKR
jgi:hypothetical protein